jgi:hypothetical protein
MNIIYVLNHVNFLFNFQQFLLELSIEIIAMGAVHSNQWDINTGPISAIGCV